MSRSEAADQEPSVDPDLLAQLTDILEGDKLLSNVDTNALYKHNRLVNIEPAEYAVYSMDRLFGDNPFPPEIVALFNKLIGDRWHNYRMSATQRVIAEMLTENCGTHMLDSGGAYGRHWQRNQGRMFMAEPAVTLDLSYAEISVTLNLFWWLSEHLEYDHKKTKKYEKWCRKRDLCPDLQGMNERGAWMQRKNERYNERVGGARFTGLYSDGDPLIINSYNNESLLDQVIQYLYWEDVVDGGAFVLLSIHGGADVRGGYSDAKVFSLNYECGIFNVCDARIYCSNEDCDSYWTTDDGYHWYFESCCGAGAGAQLETYDMVHIDDIDSAEHLTGEPVDPVGNIIIDADGTGNCPRCGKGRLEV